ncbi:Lytic transglycosylase domain-containing protein (plasmid) [Rhodovastum atsumiense]|uniref:Lytic transglycosylase domain-containing protein n=1 Tax=Rhodovastum atsumiense TaxID=504468 RepID=A0A5M6IKT1_9PROT|nr:transglycosylase SLT domain-containing protein [Rhodovastum atsumiense]KAA5608527.1 lytic transglycosylase domain-containing protein [Rhodovastum atsumiense]CAH2605805.1 Lytic transglycosylase domain-containing protein [Rhodovastum atsumiense]
MKRRSLLLLLPACLTPRGGAYAADEHSQLDFRDTVWAEAARRAGVEDPLLVYAIALFESGLSDGRGRMAPYPWTLGYAGRDVRARSRDEAERQLAGIATSMNVDIGLMQVNWAAHHHRVTRAADLLDPTTNVLVGGQILGHALRSAPQDFLMGLGRYHSWTPWRARWYGTAVWQLYLRLVGVASLRRRERLT